MNKKEFLGKLENPDIAFSSAPFWAWNGKLEKDELIRQIDDFQKSGNGGFFMHARVGLNTKYLSDEWFDCVRLCADEAEKRGMQAWLYDEDRWPSGSCGGRVSKENPEFTQRWLRAEFLEKPDYEKSALGWFAAKPVDSDGKPWVFRSNKPEDLPLDINEPRKLQKGDALKPGEMFLRMYSEPAPNMSWYNDGAYIDNMNPAAVRRFLELTHESYAREIPEKFGKSVPGIFTDEPNCSNWSELIPEQFRKDHGYDLMEKLPEIFFRINGEEYSKIRLDYQDTRTNMFVNACSRQISAWCEKHGLKYTGHVLEEDNIGRQAAQVGSAMRFYEYMQMPGMDLLTEHWNVFQTAKQVVSMAHQFGHRNRLSETYGCTGWDFPFIGHKALGDWQLACGINFRCMHLAYYTMQAEAKRDYPASISYQSPWFDRYSEVERYFCRLGSILDTGDEVRDLLILLPIESAWFCRPISRCSEKVQTDMSLPFNHFFNEFLRENIDFDFGEEEVMSRHASVNGKRLSIAQASYKAVALPQLITIRRTTLELLEKFADNGGCVVYEGTVPEYMDGLPSAEPKRVFAKFKGCAFPEMIRIVEPVAREVSMTQDGKEIEPLLYRLTRSAEQNVLFVCNTGMIIDDHSRTESVYTSSIPIVRDRKLTFDNVQIRWNVPENQEIYEIDPRTKECWKIESVYKNGSRVFKTCFPQVASRLFVASSVPLAEEFRSDAEPVLANAVPPEGSVFPVRRSEPNVFVLDHPSYSVNGSPESLPAYVNKLDDHLHKILGVRPRNGGMCQPWTQPQNRVPSKTIELQLFYDFKCGKLPKELRFAVETPELYTYKLNGHAFTAKADGWWVDRSLKTLPLPAEFLLEGENRLELACTYHEYLPGLENAYLLGEFGVDKHQTTLQELPEQLTIGDWCRQGFPNYAGNMFYTLNFKRPETDKPIYLEIPEWRGVALSVRVNGSDAKLIPWPPYRLEVTSYLKPGVNTVEIEVIGHRRNSHGPFYQRDKWPAWTGPETFKFYDVTERQIVPCGLLETPVLKF